MVLHMLFYVILYKKLVFLVMWLNMYIVHDVVWRFLSYDCADVLFVVYYWLLQLFFWSAMLEV
jgi:hypothetical protein